MRTISRLLLAIILTTLPTTNFSEGAEQADTLAVEINSEGVGLVKALLTFSSPPSHVHTILTDYPHWPALFINPPTIHSIVRKPDHTVVDMEIPAFLLPFTLRLVTATREVSPLRIETQLMEGDFSQYEWIWELSPTLGGNATRATMVYKVAPTIWTPDWIFRWALQSELEGHFEKIRQRLKRQVPIPSDEPTVTPSP